MNEPKILPWMARRAGISLDEARAAWAHAVADAAALTGVQDGARFHGLAIDRFMTLLGADPVVARQPAAQTKPTLRGAGSQPTRLACLPLGSRREPSASIGHARKGAEPWRKAA